MLAELALVGEAGVQCDLRQGQVRPRLQELLGPLDAARDDVLVWRQPGGSPELPSEVVDAETGDSGHLLQTRARFKVFLKVLDDGTELHLGERAVPRARGLVGRQDVP